MRYRAGFARWSCGFRIEFVLRQSDSPSTTIQSAAPLCETVPLAPLPMHIRQQGKGAHEKIVAEVTEYLLRHNGPDAKGRAHPTKVRLTSKEISEGLKAAKAQGLSSEWRPFHFPACIGIYDKKPNVDAVIKLRIESSLRNNFGGNILRLIREIDSPELKKPVSCRVAGRTVTVSTAVAMGKEVTSPFRVVRRYLLATGQDELARSIRPYHFRIAPKNTYQQKEIVDELVNLKVTHLLATKYGGSLGALFAGVTDKELKAPVPILFGGERFQVSYFALCIQKFGGSPWEFIQYYLEINGVKSAWSALRPYHLADSPQNTFDDPQVRDEILEKKVAKVIADRYQGSLWELIRHTDSIELTSQFVEVINGFPFTVSVKSTTDPFGGSAFAIVCRYIEITGRQREFWGLRPYHFERACRNTLDDEELLNELVRKKLDPSLEAQFNGDLVDLVLSTNYSALRSPIQDFVGDYEIEVPFQSALRKLQSSFAILQRYLKAHGRADLAAQFRPYMMIDAPAGTYQDRELCDELLVRKLDYLLSSRYQNDRLELLSRCTLEELQAPLTIDFGDRKVTVGCYSLMSSFGSCVSETLERYYELKGWPFPYTWLCFQGSPETRLRRLTGRLSLFDRARTRDEDGICDTRVFGFSQFHTEGKDEVRAHMAQLATEVFGSTPIRYLGLETEQFLSLRILCRSSIVDLAASVVIERNPRTFRAMAAMRAEVSRTLSGFRNLNLVEGELDSRLPGVPGSFNFLNFDFIGHLSSDKIAALEALFRGDFLDPETLLFVTLADRGIDRVRAARAGFGPDQLGTLMAKLEFTAGEQYRIERLCTLRYPGGSTTARRQAEMVCLGLRLSKKTS